MTLRVVLILALCSASPAQSASGSSVTKGDCGVSRPVRCLSDIVHDQAGIWTSPLRIRAHDLAWIVPFAAATGAALSYDDDAMKALGRDPLRSRRARQVSDWAGIYVPVSAVGASYVAGTLIRSDHVRETGLLSGEAMLDAFLVTQGLKYATNRERPDQGSSKGDFWPDGTEQFPVGLSFPSGHSAGAWAFARVISREYPHWYTRAAAYGLASTVSVTRVVGRRHFPSDVVVGSTFGYLIGGYVFHHRAKEPDRFSLAPDLGPRSAGFSISFAP
jgi:membrane-associated phospholipid phosphatase